MEQQISSLVLKINGHQVILDFDLAKLYGVTTKVLNQAVKRNPSRFPNDFVFQIEQQKKDELVTNCDRLKTLKHSLHSPYAYTEHGIAMLSSVLKSEMAVQVNIHIVRVFVNLRKEINNSTILISRISNIETMLLDHDSKIKFLETTYSDNHPKSGIFFNNQIFDAYTFSSDIIKSAKKSIVLIDNYIDESTLLQLSKRNADVTCLIYTERITPAIKLDLEKHNSQYPTIHIRILKNTHDRFLIIDNRELYHLGASLKDLGKRWFAFSRIDGLLKEVQARLK
jgi:hypothetical protein